MQGLVPCFAIALVETKENWAWFLRLVLKSIENVDDLSIPLISDRQKGLIAAEREVFPDKVHGNCAHHLHANVKTNHGRLAEKFFLGSGVCTYQITVSKPLLPFCEFLLWVASSILSSSYTHVLPFDLSTNLTCADLVTDLMLS